ncbi:hypothetical protein MACK_003847 [Theileria orientalis]|uniref:Uncharacterized protein n=1 Tax=Theileria orientalis TaxID=68886 RepID=A0A976SJ04_THEOR|nr:hypothetical protein MACK_003847 [Theileria orientalis]
MAYRYLRHGLYTRRKKLEVNGFKPFIDNLMWTVTNFHYQYYFNNISKHSILSNQAQIDKLVKFTSSFSHANTSTPNNPGTSEANLTGRSPIKYMRCAIPQIVPYRRQTNPFCPNSSNKTGFQFKYKNLLKYPRPIRNRKLAITDLEVPQFPKHT